MTKVAFRTNLPQFFNRDEFLMPFDRLFDKVMENQFPNFTEEFGVKCFEGGAYPKVNVYEYEDKIGIIAEIPGLNKNDLSIEIEKGHLIISGERKFSNEKNNFHSIENGYGKFTRSFQLPENIIEGKITAIHKNGMLNISVPKDSKTSIKKTIQIK